jgi:hypothetical protein
LKTIGNYLLKNDFKIDRYIKEQNSSSLKRMGESNILNVTLAVSQNKELKEEFAT